MAKSHICVTDLLKSEQKESCIKVWKVMLRLWWNQTDGKQDIKSHKVSRQRKETEFQKTFFQDSTSNIIYYNEFAESINHLHEISTRVYE